MWMLFLFVFFLVENKVGLVIDLGKNEVVEGMIVYVEVLWVIFGDSDSEWYFEYLI